MPTRTFFLIDGTITTVNEAIVGATGAYSSFTGGNIFENATGSDPYEADLFRAAFFYFQWWILFICW